MAAFQTVTSYLNAAFSRDNIGQDSPKRELFRAREDRWGAGRVIKGRAPVFTPFGLNTLGSRPEASRKWFAIYHLFTRYRRNRRPPSSLPGLWLTIWHSPDTPPTKGGITILMKSRYPSDAHPAEALKAG